MRGLYAIVDPEHCLGRDPVWVAERILEGGCAALQLRAKRMQGRGLLTTARALVARCRAASVPFWINDHLDVALLVEADGLHLGQGDLPIAEVRRLWGARQIGLSTHTLEQVRAAAAEGADLLGFGPVFATASKHSADPVVGIHGLAQAVEASTRPVVAIGGITQEHTDALRTSGASWAAAIGALCGANDPAAAALALHSRLKEEKT